MHMHKIVRRTLFGSHRYRSKGIAKLYAINLSKGHDRTLKLLFSFSKIRINPHSDNL